VSPSAWAETRRRLEAAGLLGLLEAAEASGPEAADRVPYEAIITMFNEILPGTVPRVTEASPLLKGKIRARWDESASRQTLVFWRGLFQHMAASDFLTGLSETGFRATLLWALGRENMEKIQSGIYHRSRQAASPTAVHNAMAARDWLGRDD
jgi:hypothetical protein